MGKNRDSTKTDFSSFMCIILMLTGALVTIMIANVMIISANPENVQITSIVPSGSIDESGGSGELQKDAFGNTLKSPWYVDVWRDHIQIHPEPPTGQAYIEIHELEIKDNPFERFLVHVGQRADKEYAVLLVRPWASSVARQLKKIILDRGIDIGMDLMDGTSEIQLRTTGKTQQNPEAGAAPAAPPAPAPAAPGGA